MGQKESESVVKIKPGRSVVWKTGKPLTIIEETPCCIVDGHAHIENGACVPLPLLRDKVPAKLHLNRKVIDGLGRAIMPFDGEVPALSTLKIGNRIVEEMDEAFNADSVIGQTPFYKDCDIFLFAVIQMMDMEYAWIGGYDGLTLYFEDDTPWYYYERKTLTGPKAGWKKKKLSGENQKTFSKWKDQYIQTVEAIKSNPLRLLGMYHYEPRRWNYPKNEQVEDNFQKGAWNYPFEELISPKGDGLFIGFKMYPPLGYKPLDQRLPFLHDKAYDGDCFYGRCEREGIPILSHCSPGGMSTHECDLYMEFDGKSNNSATDEAMPEATRNRIVNPEAYFWANYVHPRAWREVLVRFPALRLCLAHFGGDQWAENPDNSDWITEIIALTEEYPNVYTDVSCWNIGKVKDAFASVLSRNAHLRKKILFGTDWYMTLLPGKWMEYETFCENFWKFFQELPDGDTLWEQLTFVNPFTFYGFYEKGANGQGDRLDLMAAALRKKGCKESLLKENLAKIRCVRKYYEQLIKR